MKSLRKFRYRPAKQLAGWGYRFDSVTEVKFAISVMEEYAFMRSPVSIYFHPGSGALSPHPRIYHRRYTPDFLIRHLETKLAYLIEIKPRAYEGNPELEMHEKIASSYIQTLKFDWVYKVVFDDQIMLGEEQLKDFEQFLRIKDDAIRFEWFTHYIRKMTVLPGHFPDKSKAHIDFIMRGWTSAEPNLFTR